MSKLTTFKLACAVILALICSGNARAFNASSFANNSKLASGKWVKVMIPESGVYEITYDELREMGFNNPAQVKVYGHGGNRINEVMNSSFDDDLSVVPILRINDKICFYGNGPISMKLVDYTSTPHYTRQFNPYSLVGCYFLSDTPGPDTKPSKKSAVVVNNYVDTDVSLGYFLHEKDLISISSSGKEMLGEDFTNSKLYVDYYLPEIADSTIVVQTVIAANVSNSVSYANAVLHSRGGVDTTSYSVASSRIYVPSSDYVHYNYASPFARLKLTHPAERGAFEPILTYSGTEVDVRMSRLDYFLLTYKHRNILKDETDNQILMGYAMTSGNERFQLPNASSSTVVWSINNTNLPLEITTTQYDDAGGTGMAFFSSATSMSNYVAFDPMRRLKKISGFESVPNQNLHALSVPDMLIITDKLFHSQAQRVADMHTAIDGMTVHVVDQDQIFNEFSSGTKDAMAYRLFCKMFYDRDNTKFKNLLLFGTGTFDNREAMGEHPGYLLTYQSDNSNYEDFSYTSDDFFGLLDDNSGNNVAADKLRIGIGRITCADIEEAESDVDKLVEYYANPDYGVWRNNTLVITDQPPGKDATLYTFQGEGYKMMIDNDLQTGMNVTTVHNIMYPRSATEFNIDMSRKRATEANHLLSDMLKDGMYYATYVGHAGKIAFTKVNNMWTTGDVSRTSYPRWPIMSTACCDVAHYDGDSRGIAELMFHKRDGGAIALLTSSRMVYATGNDMLNRYFIEGMFSYATTGKMPTLGEAYMKSKLGFAASNTNKLSFFLLGDPGIKVNYPISRIEVIDLNGYEMTDTNEVATIRPLQSYDIIAHVVDANGNLDASFNGDLTMTLYDKEVKFTTLTESDVERKVYFNRNKLGEVSGRVENGVFTGSMIVPKEVEAVNENVLIRLYAHKDNSDYMVNGFTKRVKMLPYNDNVAIRDTEAPVITSMYINDENGFVEGATVGSNSMLYITATDDQGISMQANSLEHDMTLVLDGGKLSFGDIASYVTVGDMGKLINIKFPLSNLGEGLHTLTYTVFDMLGNYASRTITFMVGQSGVVTIMADKLPAYTNQEVNFEVETELARMPEVAVTVTDATGKLVWKSTSNNFPMSWDLKDMQGNKVPAGLYRYFGTYSDGSNYGGTPINQLIVVEPVKTAAK